MKDWNGGYSMDAIDVKHKSKSLMGAVLLESVASCSPWPAVSSGASFIGTISSVLLFRLQLISCFLFFVGRPHFIESSLTSFLLAFELNFV